MSTVKLFMQNSGLEITNFDRYDICLSLFEPAQPFQFSLWNQIDTNQQDNPFSAWKLLQKECRLGEQILFTIDDAPQLNGPITTRKLVRSREKAELIISGTDISGPAVDWDADPRITIANKTLIDTLELLFEPLGIFMNLGVNPEISSKLVQGTNHRANRRNRTNSANNGDENPPFIQGFVDHFRARPGEKFWQAAEELARKHGVILWVSPDSDLNMSICIDLPNYNQSPVFQFTSKYNGLVATPESNVLNAEFTEDIRGVPTIIYSSGRGRRGDATATRIKQEVTNTELESYPSVRNPLPPRPKWMNKPKYRTNSQAKSNAEKEMGNRMKDWRTYKVTVQGHSQLCSDGIQRIYSINSMARVYDQLYGINEDMLIQNIQFSGSRSEGQLTHLTLGTKNSFQISNLAAD